MILNVFSPIQSSLAAEDTENMKVDDALLEVMGITYDNLIAGNKDITLLCITMMVRAELVKEQ